ncbi:dgd1 suppressor 1 [Forsythia ovata]|uniref:Dgd1 suppressor 1 n=1 Tax=Forsythia ovata TaxID=205694 RepID=A0ABD1VFF2_9LAMI
MDSPPENESVQPNIAKSLVSFYSNYLYNRFLTFFPTLMNSTNNFLSKISNIYGSTKRRRRKTGLPLPLPPATTTVSSDQPSVTTSEGHRIFEALEDIMGDTLQNLHNIQKNLRFWQSRAEGSNAQKAYFMLCERGPYAFFNGTIQLIHDYLSEGSGMRHVYCSASSHISERISVLTSLRYFLATFLAEIYMEVDRVGENLVKDLERSLPSFLVAINDLFMKLEASIGHFHANCQSGSSVDESYSFPLIFAKLPEVNQEGSQWTDCEIRDAINLIYQNLHRLDSYLIYACFQTS